MEELLTEYKRKCFTKEQELKDCIKNTEIIPDLENQLQDTIKELSKVRTTNDVYIPHKYTYVRDILLSHFFLTTIVHVISRLKAKRLYVIELSSSKPTYNNKRLNC